MISSFLVSASPVVLVDSTPTMMRWKHRYNKSGSKQTANAKQWVGVAVVVVGVVCMCFVVKPMLVFLLAVASAVVVVAAAVFVALPARLSEAASAFAVDVVASAAAAASSAIIRSEMKVVGFLFFS